MGVMRPRAEKMRPTQGMNTTVVLERKSNVIVGLVTIWIPIATKTATRRSAG